MTNPAQGQAPNPQRPTGSKTMTDLLALADAERTLVNWLLRQRGACLADIVAHTQIELAATEAMLNDLIAAGFLVYDVSADPAVYKPNLVSRKPRTVPDQLWNAID